MSKIDLYIAGVKLEIQTSTDRLHELFVDYFSYYLPVRDKHHACARVDSIRVELSEEGESFDFETILPVEMRLISQTGVLRMVEEPQVTGGRYYLQTESAIYRVDREERTIRGWIKPAAFLYPHILANTYTLFPILLLLRGVGRYHLHAAALLSPGGSLWLVSGAQRSGKTTLTTSLGLSGWRPISDDSLLLSIDQDGELRIEALRKYFHIGDALLDRWSALDGMVRHHNYLDRTCVRGYEFFDSEEEAEALYRRVDHILLPGISGEDESRIRPTLASDVLLTLGEQSVYLQLWREHTIRQWSGLERIAKQAIGWRLGSGLDLLESPRKAAEILESVEMRGPAGCVK